MTETTCPFCHPDEEQVFYRGTRVVGMWDAFPVSSGHALVVPQRHFADWFDADPEEQAELAAAIEYARETIEQTRRPDGYNIGINVGRAAGQTIFHLHIHVIPRYDGDVPDPRGGVRHVIPEKANYLTRRTEISSGDRLEAPGLVTGGFSDPLLPHLLDMLDGAQTLDIAAAFTLESGVRLIEEHLRDLLHRGGRIRLLTGDYLGVTQPSALSRLLDIQNESALHSGTLRGEMQLRIFQSNGKSFHPKAYIVTHRYGNGVGFVGSSNLSETALRHGVEWNYRIVTSGDHKGLSDVLDAFDELWADPRNKEVDPQWIREYQARRVVPAPKASGVAPEPPPLPPKPHDVQAEALDALVKTREAGNTAGLVVLATGLGKTWLSAFDSTRAEFERILFVAHREEILSQAMRTFRTIKPDAELGYFNGSGKEPSADVVFASIQTLSKRQHLNRFDPYEFDYVVVDEFHHAAAHTYRRVLGYLEPKFLLGLTATPERMDGGDLLSLCGDNLVYRCDVNEGIRRGLLSPFDYYGVPDDIDYENIPWLSNRFDEEKLTQAFATEARAENALEQYRRLGGSRTLAFCVSQRHADYMAEYFSNQNIQAVAVHSGDLSAPRAHSLEQLRDGELEIIFAVDMFNEGIDIPNIDTVLMLRPTESRNLWLQQFGRGLRYQDGKALKVIDYIGNHRVFLNKIRALFNLGTGDREVAYALDRYESGDLDLPGGCSVTYDLSAIDVLRGLIRTSVAKDPLKDYYEDFKERNGERPLASEVFEDGYDPKVARKYGYASWFDFVQKMGDLSAKQAQLLTRFHAFLEQLETTPMTKSYKMLVLMAMLDEDAIPGDIRIDRLSERFGTLARRYAGVRSEVGEPLTDMAALQRLIEQNPIAAWVGGKGTGGTSYFSFVDGVLKTAFSVADEARESFQDLIRELAEWRLLAYLRRKAPGHTVDRIVCRVSHANGRPILFLPNRSTQDDIPEGWQKVLIDGEVYQANFVKIAINVLTRPGSTENVLPQVLRSWFGNEAGRAGHSDDVVFVRAGDAYKMLPATDLPLTSGPLLWQGYSREAAFEVLGIKPKGWEPQQGIVRRPGLFVLFVTLDKDALAEEYQYKDHLVSPTEFQWQSQNQNSQAGKVGQEIYQQEERGIQVHLFVRGERSAGGAVAPFIYCGQLSFVRWEGEKPITVWWRLEHAVPPRLWRQLKLPRSNAPKFR